jgi:hypothetical protein
MASADGPAPKLDNTVSSQQQQAYAHPLVIAADV